MPPHPHDSEAQHPLQLTGRNAMKGAERTRHQKLQNEPRTWCRRPGGIPPQFHRHPGGAQKRRNEPSARPRKITKRIPPARTNPATPPNRNYETNPTSPQNKNYKTNPRTPRATEPKSLHRNLENESSTTKRTQIQKLQNEPKGRSHHPLTASCQPQTLCTKRTQENLQNESPLTKRTQRSASHC